MNSIVKTIINIVCTIILIITFIPALHLENAAGKRLTILVILFIVFNIWLMIRAWIVKKHLIYSFAVDIILLIFIEHYSRFVVNYYFSIYPLIIVIFAALLLNAKETLIVSSVTFLISMIKFIRLLVEAFNYSYPLYQAAIRREIKAKTSKPTTYKYVSGTSAKKRKNPAAYNL